MEKKPESVEFRFVNSNYWRVIHADGVYGGVTPRGDILMSVWSQRTALPTSVTHEILADGLGKEIARESSGAVIRELEAGIVLDVELAKVVVKWLQEKIKDHSKLVQSLGDENDPGSNESE